MKDTYLIFDFDDTLVRTCEEFERTNREAARFLRRQLMSPPALDVILQYQRQLDVSLVPSWGLLPDRYRHSWTKTYDHFLEKHSAARPPEWIHRQLSHIVNHLYQRSYRVYPHALSVLSTLQKIGYSLLVLTAGDSEIQYRKAKEAGILTYIDEIIICPHKTPEKLREVMNRYPARQYAMIGNSLKSDVYPALSCEIPAFHLVRETWEADHHDVDQSHPFYIRVSSLLHLLRVIPKQLPLSRTTTSKEGAR